METDDAGAARVAGLAEGYYEVEEIVAPEGFVLDSTRHGVQIDPYDPATEDDPVLTVVNEAKPSLRIVKYDRESMKPLADTTFKVYRDTELIGSYTTDRDGEILLSGLEPGTYTVEEVAAPGTHVVNSTPQQIELKAGANETATLIFFNSMKPGIHLVKVDSVTLKPLYIAQETAWVKLKSVNAEKISWKISSGFFEWRWSKPIVYFNLRKDVSMPHRLA